MEWIDIGAAAAGVIAGLARHKYYRARIITGGDLPIPFPANDETIGAAPATSMMGRNNHASRGHTVAIAGEDRDDGILIKEAGIS